MQTCRLVTKQSSREAWRTYAKIAQAASTKAESCRHHTCARPAHAHGPHMHNAYTCARPTHAQGPTSSHAQQAPHMHKAFTCTTHAHGLTCTKPTRAPERNSPAALIRSAESWHTHASICSNGRIRSSAAFVVFAISACTRPECEHSSHRCSAIIYNPSEHKCVYVALSTPQLRVT